jgi:hypothetical protein
MRCVKLKFTVSKNTNSWFIKQAKSGVRVSDIVSRCSAEESHCSPAVIKRGVRKHQIF